MHRWGSIHFTADSAAFEREMARARRAVEVVAHQPRERAVPCQRCRKPTFEVHAICTACGPATCEHCSP